MVLGTRANASVAMTNAEVVMETTSKTPVFSGNHGNDWTIWEMKMTAHLMEKGLDPTFETKTASKREWTIQFGC